MKTCSRCLVLQPFENFHKWTNSKDGYSSHCKECYTKYRSKKYRDNRIELNNRVTEWRRSNPELSRQVAKNSKHRRKMEALIHYSGSNNPFCACCGEDDPRFLTIDHKNNDGKKERIYSQRYGGLALWLRKRGYPDGYQVLCFNCNCGKGAWGGVCPHNVPMEPIPPAYELTPVDLTVCSHCNEPGDFFPSRPRVCKKCVIKYKKDRLTRLKTEREFTSAT